MGDLLGGCHVVPSFLGCDEDGEEPEMGNQEVRKTIHAIPFFVPPPFWRFWEDAFFGIKTKALRNYYVFIGVCNHVYIYIYIYDGIPGPQVNQPSLADGC